MGETITLRAADGFGTTAYVARPAGKPKGGLVVIQEIFGVNHHMRGVADGFARDGYVAIVPALFDRIRPNIELGYDEAAIARGRELKGASPTDAALLDIAAARDAIAGSGKLGVIGYCWGGLLVWVSATRLKGFAAAVSYYGGGIGAVAAEKPSCPVQFHFGEKDHAIPLTEVDKVKTAGHKAVEVNIYPAGHGFNCDERGSFDAASTKLARGRALAFLNQHVAGIAPAKTPAAPTKPVEKPAAKPTATKVAVKSKAKPVAKKAAAAKPKPAPQAKPKARAQAKPKAAPKRKAAGKKPAPKRKTAKRR